MKNTAHSDVGGVAVIIPAFNRSAYIKEAIESVLGQTFKDLELIVVDDGSTDGTYEILQSYGDRITLITHAGRVNRGQSASINLGLSIANGKYIAILDSDDYWEPQKLEIQVRWLEANPDFGLIYSNGWYVNAEGKHLHAYHSKHHVETNDPDARLLDCYMALPVNALVRKSVYDQVGGFEEGFRASQDHDMLVRIGEVTKFGYIPDFLFSYRRHGDAISTKNLDVRWRNGFEILRRAGQRYPYRKETLRKRKAVLHYRMAQVSMAAKRWPQVAYHGIMAALLDPARSLRVLTGAERKS